MILLHLYTSLFYVREFVLTPCVVFSSNIIMPKKKQSKISRLRNFVLEFEDDVFSVDDRYCFVKFVN